MAAHPDAIAAYASLLTPAQCGAALVFMPGSGAGLGSAARAHGRFLLDADALDGWLIGLLLPGTDRFAALATPNYFLAAHLARHRPDLGIRYVAAPDLAGWIAAQLPSHHRIGLIGGGEMPAWLLTGLQVALPQTALAQTALPQTAWLALDTEAHRLRQAKAPRDLARHEAAAALCDHLFAAIPAFLVKQPAAPRLQELIRREAYDQGCNDCRSWISYGPMGSDADIMAPDPAQRLDSGTSSVTVGLMLTLDGAFGHAIRSYSLGPAPAALLAAHDALLAAGDRLFQGLRPTNAGSGPNAAERIATLEAEARAELAARGYPQGFAFRLGHALGYAYEDPPLSALFQQPFDRASNQATAAAPETLTAPSLFELHPSLHLPGLGLIAQGDMLLVETEANRWALKTPRAIIPV